MAVSFTRSVQVVDSHTAGHPTRVILGGLPPLAGESVRAQRDDFRARHDSLRPTLLHEPRGHAAMVAGILVPSRVADFGAFFISTYVYLDMCGHGTIGLAKTLAATGQIDVAGGSRSFTLETPAGVVTVGIEAHGGKVTAIRIDNVAAHVLERRVEIDVPGLAKITADIAYGGGRFAMVDAKELAWPIRPDTTSDLCRKGAAIKAALNARPGKDGSAGSVLFHEDLGPRRARHLVVLEGNKFDRSPCGTGTSARLAVLHDEGKLGTGEEFIAEGVLGTSFRSRIERISSEGIHPSIIGNAHLTAFSTIVVEEGDPLAGGFLCR
jgi:proline racemase